MPISYLLDGREIRLTAERDGADWRILLPDGSTRRVSAEESADGALVLREANRTVRIPFARVDGGFELSYEGAVYRFESAGAARQKGGGRSRTGQLLAPMTGTITDVLVKEGDEVAAYQPLVVVEAMKVLATLEAPFAGTVVQLNARKGAQVDHGALVIEITPLTF